MSVLVSLPSSLVANIITGLLNFKDLGVLDIAYSTGQLRPVFLEELRSLPCTECFPFNHPEVSHYRWIRIRGIKTDRCVLKRESFMKGHLAFDIDLSLIVVLVIVGEQNSKSMYLKIINLCKNLKELVCYNFDPISGVHSAIMKRLTSIVMYGSENNCAPSLKYIAASCTQLQKLYCFQGSETSALIAPIAERNLKLVDVRCTAQLDVLEYLVTSCSRVNNILLDMIWQVNLQCMTQKITEDPLASVTLRYVSYNNVDGTRRVRIDNYPNTNNDLDTFLAATKDLVEFLVTMDTYELITDSMVTNVVHSSFHTLKCFFCDMVLVSTETLRRVLVECTQLEEVRLNAITDSHINAFQELHLIKLKSLNVNSDNLKLSSALVLLSCCRHLKTFAMGDVSVLDVEMDVILKHIMDYYYGTPDVLQCDLRYVQNEVLKWLTFDGLFFQYKSRIHMSELF